MLHYTLKRLAGTIPTLFLIVTIAFFLIRLAPGGPFDRERPVPAQIAANLDAAYHLDEPLPMQYLHYLGNLLRGDFGPSFKYQDYTVTELIWQGFPVSLKLGAMAMGVALLLGVVLGTIAALRQNHLSDYLVMTTAMTGIVVPNFVLAPVLGLVFGIHLGWLPVGGWGDAMRYSILPVTALALPQVAYIARMTRASLIEVLQSPWIQTAHAKGLPLRRILWRHAAPATLLPIISYLGPATAAIITGSVVVEQIFGIPGIGRYFVQGALNRDYTLVMGVVVFYGVLIIGLNLIVDLLYAAIDPRIRHSRNTASSQHGS